MSRIRCIFLFIFLRNGTFFNSVPIASESVWQIFRCIFRRSSSDAHRETLETLEFALIVIKKLFEKSFPVPDRTNFKIRICNTFALQSIFHDFSVFEVRSILVNLTSFLTGFRTLVRACSRFFAARISLDFWYISRSRYFGGRISEKRLARIRTLARLRRSVYRLEPVMNTTAPPPRWRVKGVRFEVIAF